MQAPKTPHFYAAACTSPSRRVWRVAATGLQTAVGIRARTRCVEVVGRRGLCSPSCVATGKSLGFWSLSMTQLIELRRVWLRLGVFLRWQEVQRFQTVLLSLFRRKIQYFWNLIAKWKFPSFLLLRPQEIRSKLIGLRKQSAFILGKYFHHRSIHP